MGLFDFLSEIDTGNLASDARWAIIQAGIEIGLTSGYSMSRTAAELRAGGLAFSNEPYRELFRELSGYKNQFDYQTRIGADLFPNPNLMAESKFPIEGDFGYVGRFQYRDSETLELRYKTFRLDSDELLTRNQALEELQYIAAKYPTEFEDRLTDVEFIGSVRNL